MGPPLLLEPHQHLKPIQHQSSSTNQGTSQFELGCQPIKNIQAVWAPSRCTKCNSYDWPYKVIKGSLRMSLQYVD